MDNDIKKLNVWMPIQKSSSGGFVGILSDDSIDRDGEFMSKRLLQSWVKDTRPLPMLANHENKLEKLIGGWTEKKLISKGDRTALVARPFFLESNPLGVQAKAMVEEALEKGMEIGISIGAIPKGEMVEKEVDGQTFKGFTEAEILEATIVPIQSNRNASFTAMAKSFDINLTVSKQSEDIDTMAEEITKEQAPAEAQPVEEVLEEVEAKSEEELPSEEVEEKSEEAEEKSEEAEKSFDAEEIKKLKQEVEELKKYKEQAVLKGTVEGPAPVKKEVEPTFVNLLKARYGGNQ